MNLTIANVSTSIDDATFANVVAALSQQVSQDFQPEWGAAAQLTPARLDLGGGGASINSATDAIIYLGDSTDDPTAGISGVYGYHSTNYSHIPYGFVFLNICAAYGEDWSVTLSHEVLELLADPTAVLTVTGEYPPDSGTAVYYDLEVCDPTQGDTYLINSIKVSNFVSRSYFGMPGGSQATNFRNLALQPFGLRPGGYLQYEDGTGAHQINGSKVTEEHKAARKLLAGHRRNSRRSAKFQTT
jgi:hypothetical protein